MVLRCTFCNEVFQGTRYQATRHFVQMNYCKDISYEALVKGLLDCQARLEVEAVRTGTRRRITHDEIAQQVALITRDPVEASAPPSADVIFDRRACIFRPYPRDDDSDEEPILEAADDPALRVPHEINETHDDLDDVETRTHAARRAANRADREMTGGDKDFWGPFGEVATTDDVRDDKVRGLHAGTSRTEARMTTPTLTRRELSMPPPSALSLAPPSPEEAVPSAAVEGEVAAAEGDAVAQQSNNSGAVEGEVVGATMLEEVRSAAVVEGEVATAVEEIAAATDVLDVVMQRDGADDTESSEAIEESLMHPVVRGITPGVVRGLGMFDSEMGAQFDFDMSMGVAPSCGGVHRRIERHRETRRQARPRSRRRRVQLDLGPRFESSDTCVHARGVDVSCTGRGRGRSRPRARGTPRVPAQGGVALGESSRVEGLGMPRGSHCQQTVAQASMRVVLVRKGGGPVAIKEEDPETAPIAREDDEDYEGEEESEEESERGDNNSDDDDEDQPPPPHRRMVRDVFVRRHRHPHEGRGGQHAALGGV
ncbi:hypothetical protein CBR_g88580 [Chara braunii]|uniref:Uncharacterized protein n=1 Tax=Chara braunii TaxID=69332 RepID=A0A388KB57_CHABU|nr:hypothetical protein CBR_g88580 [Chara braunii]|eukprot:GBG67292.1 hypothetical protein CBR_g88580 [Chara braunii]